MNRPEPMRTRAFSPHRRHVLTTLGALAAAPLLPLRGSARAATPPAIVEAALVVSPASARLAPRPHPETAVWAYNGQTPGPVLRVRQGDRLRVQVDNRLSEPTTVHWHGIRLPNAMDGVPGLTQPPIAPGERFVYEYTLPDAGTFFYHPHLRSHEQVARGLAGALIVEEREPIAVDRDEVWVLGDWRLDRDASIRGGFGAFMDASHDGRIGNTVTLNGQVRETFAVRSGERIRLRLINAAGARIFALAFAGHAPQVIALDGQPVEPHEPDGGVVVLAPAQRADVVIDMLGAPGSRHLVRDGFYRTRAYRLLDLVYGDEPPLRTRALDAPIRLPANPLAEPDLGQAQRHEIVMRGGMMGDMSGLPRGKAWSLNGSAGGCGEGAAMFDPLFIFRRGSSHVLRLVNDTPWHHPMHWHGHAFRVISRNGRPTARREWLDTVLLAPRESAEIAFVADNPGDWMFHCHVLDHQASGMAACLRVA